ncbi:MAG: ribonuclease Z [Gemmatimonadetes bacterium]|nr:ribonuclease Z [Gemmatimonadota bacterium]NNK62045.1 ribonuclease Z [Gemmatimonadota bacterium]
MLRVTFLGTAAARPTVGRNVSGLTVQREGALLLFDCGEGTQRQMMRFQTGFAVDDIFITHTHADHFLGLPGLLRTMGLQGRTEPLGLWGPPRSARVLERAVRLGVERVPFEVSVSEVSPGDRISRSGWRIEVFAVTHGVKAVGYALQEEDRLGRFDVERARALGVPEGPAFGRLHRGETVEASDGTPVGPDQVVGPSRPGRRLVYTGDTRPCASVMEAAEDADLLIHDATFLTEDGDRARDTGHSTAAEAAEVARRSGVRQLALTHLSARYAEVPHLLLAEARTEFDAVVVARDGMVIEVPFREGGGEGGGGEA